MIDLYLMRHGNTFEADQVPVQVGAQTDLPLTEQGRKQALWMAEYLLSQGMWPAALYAGHLKRQTQSAQIIADCFQMDILSEPALTEIDYGPWEGLSAEEISTRWPQEYAGWVEERHWPSQIFKGTPEKHLQALDRWIQSLRQNHRAGDAVVAISSNGLLQFFQSEKVKTGHFCQLHLFPDRWQIESWNTNPRDVNLRS